MIRSTALLVLLAHPAAARPPTLPTHDVTITYRAEGAAQDLVPGLHAERFHLMWSAATERLRVSPEGMGEYALVDLRAATAVIVEPGLAALSLPVRPGDLDPVRLQDARLEPRGAATVAGHPCTDYAVLSRRGSGTVCLGADGTALRGSGTVDGRTGSFTALAVDDAPIPDSAFAPPAGSLPFTLPRGLRLPR